MEEFPCKEKSLVSSQNAGGCGREGRMSDNQHGLKVSTLNVSEHEANILLKKSTWDIEKKIIFVYIII